MKPLFLILLISSIAYSAVQESDYLEVASMQRKVRKHKSVKQKKHKINKQNKRKKKIEKAQVEEAQIEEAPIALPSENPMENSDEF